MGAVADDPPRLRVIEGGGEPDDGLPEFPPITNQIQYDAVSAGVKGLELVIQSETPSPVTETSRSMAQALRWRLREWENRQR